MTALSGQSPDEIAFGAFVSAADVSVASDHGRELLDYVLLDLPSPG